MLVEITETAERDLLEICRFLGPSVAGERLVADFVRQVENLRNFPRLGSRTHPLARGSYAVFLGGGEYVMTYDVGDSVMGGG